MSRKINEMLHIFPAPTPIPPGAPGARFSLMQYKKRHEKIHSEPSESKQETIRKEMVGVTELESVTSTMSTWRSNQLSYTPETNNADPFLPPFSGNGRSPTEGTMPHRRNHAPPGRKWWA